MAKHTAWYQLNFGWLRLRPRRRFKDRLFRFLFRHKKDLPLKTAIANAIDTCIQKGILEDVLLRNRAEVLHMLLTEYDEKKHRRDTYKEGYDDGKQAGYSVGEQAGYSKGEQALLEAMIRKKLKCGKDIAVIAQELEMEPAVIQEIIERISG